MSIIQLKGEFQLAPAGEALVDYSNFISSMVIERNRNSVTEPATLGTGREVQLAGTLSETLSITFHSEMAATSLWAVLYDVIDIDDALVDWSGQFEPGAVSADNPKFSGTATLLNLNTGADVGTLRQTTVTFPITGAGITKTIVAA